MKKGEKDRFRYGDRRSRPQDELGPEDSVPG